MKPLVCLAILLAAVAAAPGQTAARQGPVASARPVPPGMHPAVVRVISPERGGMSLGSGTLIAVHGDHGLVITNWHVVSDATGQIQVVFPGGFRSPATVLKTDRNWDLAALAIWRPEVEAVRLAGQPPQLGEPLTIAGYGSGRYRAASGWCTQYVSPGRGHPFEMLEVSVAARQGDSGGPIFNRRGELAGVLFGSGFGSTAGSYCGRVQRFLASVEGDFQRLPPNPYMIAQRTPPRPEPAEPQPESVPWQPPPNYWAVTRPPAQVADPPPAQAPPSPPVAAISAKPVAANAEPAAAQPAAEPSEWTAAGAVPPAQTPPAVSNAQPAAAMPPSSAEFPGPTVGEQLKTMLAAIGAFAILFHSLRLLAVAPDSKS